MGSLRSSAPFFRPGPPAPVGQPDPEILNFLINHLEGTVLDMGGGLGAYASALQARGSDIVLAEMDPTCLESARARGLAVIDMNRTAWESLRGRFDTVVMVDVLEHVEEHREFLRNVLACARRKVLLTVPCNDDFQKLFEMSLTYNHIAVSDHVHQFVSADLSSLFDEFDCKYNIRPGSHLFPDPIFMLLQKELWGTLRGKIVLSPLKLFRRFGWLPRLFPSRAFVEVTLTRSAVDSTI